MKIGILLGPNARGGMERQASLLTKGIVDRGLLSYIYFNSRPSRSKEGMDWSPVPTKYLWRYRPSIALSQFYLGWLLRKNRIDILHVFYWGNIEFAVGAMKWAPNTVFIASHRDTDFAIHKYIQERLTKTCSAYDYFTCNSEETKMLLDQYGICLKEKVRVIYNGVVIPTSENLRERTISNTPSSTSNSQRIILFPNRFFSYKNPILFIDACADVCRKLDETRVVICGWGNLETAMKDRCRELGIMDRCQFLGSLQTEEIPYSKAGIVVNCASSREGMSNSLMEALAHGVPVVATEVGGNTELLEGCRFGRLVPVNDKEALVKAMCELLSVTAEERLALGWEARNYIATKFSVDRFVDEHIAYYKKALGRH
jgi:glycosyltransferase involved in cell wall biosynthesis